MRRVEDRLGGFPDVVCATRDGRTFLLESKAVSTGGPYTQLQVKSMMSSSEQWVFNRTWRGELYIVIWSTRDSSWWLVRDNVQEQCKTFSSAETADALISPAAFRWNKI